MEVQMKALILAAGKGTRLRPLTNSCPKHLVPVANKPVLFYGLDQIKQAGITEIGIVVSAETKSEIESTVSGNNPWGFDIAYILQGKPLGLAHAVKTARPFLKDSPFLLFLGDNILQDGVQGLLEQFQSNASDAVIALKEVEDPRRFGVAEIDARGFVQKVVEKPAVPKSNLALVGAYVFSPEIHQAIDLIEPSKRGEYEITDAIQMLISQGKKVFGNSLSGWWLDTGNKEDLLEANRVTLKQYLEPNILANIKSDNLIVDKVEILEGTILENCQIYGPVTIGENCHIIDSFIGPFTSIGPRTIIEKCRIENSIIMPNSQISQVKHLIDSVIGKNTKIVMEDIDDSPARLFLGDDAVVEI
jgi:glucose-1-phosphate thymidylyltransferase